MQWHRGCEGATVNGQVQPAQVLYVALHRSAQGPRNLASSGFPSFERVSLLPTDWLENSTEIKLEITPIETEIVVGSGFFVQLLGLGSSPSTNSRAGVPIRELNTAANSTTRPQLLDALPGHTLHRATGLHCQGQEAKGHRPAGHGTPGHGAPLGPSHRGELEGFLFWSLHARARRPEHSSTTASWMPPPPLRVVRVCAAGSSGDPTTL